MKPALKRWVIIIGAVVTVVAILVIILVNWASKSSTGTVQVGKPKPTQTTTPSPAEPLAISTPYFTTILPGDFHIDHQTETPNSPVLLQLATHSKTQQFAITYGTLPSEGLVGVGDFNLRVTQTDNYTEYRPAGLPVDSVAYRTTSGQAAFTVFWPHGTHYAEIALSGDVSLGDLFATFARSSHNWQWQ